MEGYIFSELLLLLDILFTWKSPPPPNTTRSISRLGNTPTPLLAKPFPKYLLVSRNILGNYSYYYSIYNSKMS